MRRVCLSNFHTKRKNDFAALQQNSPPVCSGLFALRDHLLYGNAQLPHVQAVPRNVVTTRNRSCDLTSSALVLSFCLRLPTAIFVFAIGPVNIYGSIYMRHQHLPANNPTHTLATQIIRNNTTLSQCSCHAKRLNFNKSNEVASNPRATSFPTTNSLQHL